MATATTKSLLSFFSSWTNSPRIPLTLSFPHIACYSNTFGRSKTFQSGSLWGGYCALPSRCHINHIYFGFCMKNAWTFHLIFKFIGNFNNNLDFNAIHLEKNIKFRCNHDEFTRISKCLAFDSPALVSNEIGSVGDVYLGWRLMCGSQFRMRIEISIFSYWRNSRIMTNWWNLHWFKITQVLKHQFDKDNWLFLIN